VRGFIVLGLLVFLAGCGASEEDKVEAVIRASDAAWERGDFDAGCSWMTERARRRYMDEGINPDARRCSEAYEFDAVETDTVGDLAATAEVVASEPPRMTGIRVDGATAVASYSNGDRTRLRKVDGRWLIDSF
jgi:hypothetical protein